MESAKIGLDPGTDPNALTANPAGWRGTANGFTTSDNAQSRAVGDPGAVARFEMSAKPLDPLGPERSARLPLPSSEPRGWLAHTVILLYFVALLFLGGIYLAASLTANPPSPTAPAGGSAYVVIPAPIEAPTADSSATADPSSEPVASPPSPTNMIPAEAAPPPSSSATALPRGGITPETEPTPEATSASGEPVTNTPPEPAKTLAVPPTASQTVTPTPPPGAPARASAAPTPDQPALSDIQRQALLSRGDAFFSAGDITSARLFYQRGADAGDGSAALRLGETYDAAFLQRAHLGGVRSDLEKAVYWYRRARDLGSTEAGILLDSLR